MYYQKDFVKMILKINLADNVQLEDAKIIHQSEMLVIKITRSNHNFQYDPLLVMFKVQLENLTKLITPHYQREENDYLKMITISMWAYLHRRAVCGLMLPSAQK